MARQAAPLAAMIICGLLTVAGAVPRPAPESVVAPSAEAGRLSPDQRPVRPESLELPPPASKLARATPEGRPEAPADWSLEELRLTGGRVYRGLIESADDEWVKFLQVRRPEGKPMYIVGLRVPRENVARLERLPDGEHEALVERVRLFRQKEELENEQMEQLVLAPARRDSWPVLRYRGPWFTLDSSADEETTRRAIVRMQQFFSAYRQILPPRVEPKQTLEIVLWGSPQQYHLYLSRHGADMANPAFFSTVDNAVIAGLELDQYARERDAVHEYRQRAQRDLKQREAEYQTMIRQAGNQLRRQGVPLHVVRSAGRQQQDSLARQKEQILRDLAGYDRQAASAFDKATGRTFAMLAHEAFHAYLENYVYPHDRYEVPRWLNEGWAQIFENGLMEGQSLRVDAPPQALLRQLRDDLQGREPVRLAELLTADHRLFLVTHPKDAETSRRNYLYSWGLAHYLTRARNLLGTELLDDFVSQQDSKLSAQQRFERLVGQPLDQFEAHWRREMTAMK